MTTVRMVRVLMNFGKFGISDIRKALLDPGPDIIVCDEGHKIKEEKTHITKALKSIKTL